MLAWQCIAIHAVSEYGPGPAPGVVGSVGELSALNVNRECVCERNAHTYTFLLTRERKVRLSKSVPTPGGAALKAPAGVLRYGFTDFTLTVY